MMYNDIPTTHLHKLNQRAIPPKQRQHMLQQPLGRRVEHRILPQHPHRVKTSIQLSDHIVYILPLLKESKPSLESQPCNNVESIPLQPNRQINRLSLQVPHRVREQLRALIDVRLVVTHVGHGEQRRHGGLEGLVDCWVAGCEHAVDGDAVVRGHHRFVEICLLRHNVSTVRKRSGGSIDSRRYDRMDR